MIASRISWAARLLFWLCFLFASVMAFLPQPPRLPSQAWGDKWEHALAFLVLTVLAQAGFGRFGRFGRWRVLAAMVAYGALIELVQMVPALGRSADLRDWLVDGAVALAVTLAAVAADRLKVGEVDRELA